MNDNRLLIGESVSRQNMQKLYSATLHAGLLYPIYTLSVHTKLLQELVTTSFPLILNHKFSTILSRLPNTHSGTQPHTPVTTFTPHPSHRCYIHTTMYGEDDKLLQTAPSFQTVHIRDSQISQNCRSHLKLLRVKRFTRSKFHSEDPQISDAILQNLLARTWR